MRESFVSGKDRLVAAAIEIISDSGLFSLSTETLAAKENMPVELIYRYFGSVDEVLSEVVDYYVRFDSGIMSTVMAKQVSNIDRIKAFFEAYTTYYESYYAMSTLSLHYEELLHNHATRDKIAECISGRSLFLRSLFEEAIKVGEIRAEFTPEELADTVSGVFLMHIQNRRVSTLKRSFKEEYMDYLDRLFDLIKAGGV